MTVIRFPAPPKGRYSTASTEVRPSADALRLEATATIHRVLVRALLERRRPARLILEAFRQRQTSDGR